MGIIDREQSPYEQTKFIPFCRVASGLSQQDFSVIRQRLERNWEKFDEHRYPLNWENWRPGSAHRPDFIVKRLDKSVVLEIKA